MLHLLRHGRPLIILIALLPLLSLLQGGRSVQAASHSLAHTALSYSCGSHCYGINNQFASDYGLNLFNGIRSTIVSIPKLLSQDAVTDEIWLAQNSAACAAENNVCWIEVGLVYEPSVGGPGERLFWADVRPNQQISLGSRSCSWTDGHYCQHNGPLIASADYGKALQLTIQVSSTSTWAISATVNGGQTSMTGTSTGNTMFPTLFQLGQELHGSGTSGQTTSATTAHFRYSQFLYLMWQTLSHNGQNNSVGRPSNPPWSGWTNGNLTPSLTNYGGDWYACTLTSPSPITGRSNPC